MLLFHKINSNELCNNQLNVWYEQQKRLLIPYICSKVHFPIGTHLPCACQVGKLVICQNFENSISLANPSTIFLMSRYLVIIFTSKTSKVGLLSLFLGQFMFPVLFAMNILVFISACTIFLAWQIIYCELLIKINYNFSLFF